MTRPCLIAGCTRPARSRRLCDTHYKQAWKAGTLPPPVTARTPEERFDRWVPERSPLGCWLWTGRLRNGYGALIVNGRTEYAHRWSYEHHVGPIPAGRQIDHLCRNRACVNPGHLEAVTQRENILRGTSSAALHARQTHCAHGHPFAGANLRISSRGTRRCRACDAAREARRVRRAS